MGLEPSTEVAVMTERSIFVAALDIDDPVRRAEFVAQACGDDARLRGHVEELLQAHEQPGGFMGRPAPNLVSTIEGPPARKGTGTVIGPYKLLEQIGEGGFGVVLLTEQCEPGRAVGAGPAQGRAEDLEAGDGHAPGRRAL